MKSIPARIGIVVALAAAVFFWYKYRAPHYLTGDQAPDFEVALADNTLVKLSDLRGKHVLLQFWGSWCGPCRRENPHLLKLYRRYHDKGFEVFSVGIEQSPKAWQRAIEQDSMIWRYHSADFNDFKGGVAKQFNITSIPATFLIDPQGMIVGVNLAPEQMEKLLSKRL